MLLIHTESVTAFEQNARIIIDADTQIGAWIDPGGDIESLQAARVKLAPKARVESILLTHSHIDHAGGVTTLLSEQPECILLAHKDDAPLRGMISQQAIFFGLSATEFRNCPEPSRYLEPGEIIQIGSKSAKVLFVPGHAPGHVAFYFEQIEFLLSGAYPKPSGRQTGPLLIGGDVLFAGGIGRTDLPLGDYARLIRSIEGEFLTLPDNTLVLSGHGPNTTIGIERQSNPFLVGT